MKISNVIKIVIVVAILAIVVGISIYFINQNNKKYTVEEVARFMIAFMKYTMNMKANDVVDHTFMSYFVSNIINIDFASTGTQEENAFVNLFCSNIERGIRLINGYDEYNTEEKEESNEEEEENIDDKSIENNEEN